MAKTAKKSTAKKNKYADWNANDILAAWEKAVRKGIGDCRVAAGVMAPDSSLMKRLRRHVTKELREREFTEADFRNSSKVALDIGKVCRLFAMSSGNKTVTQDMFDAIVELRHDHPACPRPNVVAAGPWC